MALRNIVHIDENKCNGCGLCIPNCAEGALKIVNGKVKLDSDIYCDGLGACLGHCPQDAISIIEREAEEFNEEKTGEHIQSNSKVKEGKKMEKHIDSEVHQGGCPGSRMRELNRTEVSEDESIKLTSKLRQWPVQLKLVSPQAPYFKNSDLLITADCVPFAYANYHNEFLKDRSLVVGCPKLDDVEVYTQKLTEIIRHNDLESITVLKMEVPCCGGIAQAAKVARNNSGIDIPIKVITISLEGKVIGKQYI